MKLYLIPNTLNPDDLGNTVPHSLLSTIKDIRVFFVEGPKAARALLRKIDPMFPLQECEFLALNEHTIDIAAIREVISVAERDIGIISEAGYPCVADPGADVVRIAHEQGMTVVPLPGASSIILALAASGFNG